MSRYYRCNPDEPIRHDWITGQPNCGAIGSFAPATLLARNMKLQSIARQIASIKTDGTAGQQIFINELSKECRSKEPRPVCPCCCEPMVKTTVKLEGGDVKAWLCKC